MISEVAKALALFVIDVIVSVWTFTLGSFTKKFPVVRYDNGLMRGRGALLVVVQSFCEMLIYYLNRNTTCSRLLSSSFFCSISEKH
jgi:hypothetical protein